MKIIFSVFAVLVLAFSLFETATAQIQSIKISPKKVIYKRTGEEVPDFKKTFEIIYPEISGVKNAALEKKLNDTISYWRVFDTTLEENTGDYDWLTNMDYKVNFNNDGLLAIDLTMEGVGAYPDGSTRSLVVDLNSGNQLKVKDVFTNLPKLILMVDKDQKTEMSKAIADLQKDSSEDAAVLKQMLRENKNSIKMLDEFTIGADGVTFLYDYGFPHVVQALEPEGRYKFTWQQMKPFIKANSSFGKFVK